MLSSSQPTVDRDVEQPDKQNIRTIHSKLSFFLASYYSTPIAITTDMYLRTVLLAAATLAASAALVHDQGEGIPDKEGLGVEFGPCSIPAPGALMHPGGESYCPGLQVAKSSQETSVHMRLIHMSKEDLKATCSMSCKSRSFLQMEEQAMEQLLQTQVL